MNQTFLARAISTVFHPLFWAYYVLAYMVFLYQYVFASPKGMWMFLGSSLVLMVVFPIMALWLLVKIKKVTSFEVAARNERSLPLFITGVSYYLTYTLFKTLMLPELFQLLILGATFMILLSMMVTFFWKISLHMLSVGGIIGFFLALGFRYQIVFIQIVIPLIFIAGWVGYARLKLEAHTRMQVYAGFATGLAAMFLIFVLY